MNFDEYLVNFDENLMKINETFVLENSSNLQLVNKELDELLKGDLVTGTNSIKIHLFSNILDMGNDYFNYNNFPKKSVAHIEV